MRPLYSSPEIRRALDHLYAASGPRGAIVAFVGSDARSYLPADLSDFEVICWLKPGCTDPDALRVLRRDGALLFSAERLHAKIYWSATGVVVTRANLSANGLGAGEQHETGVLLPASGFDVQRLVRQVQPQPITSKVLLRYEVAHRAFVARNEGRAVFEPRKTSRRRQRSFVDWQSLGK